MKFMTILALLVGTFVFSFEASAWNCDRIKRKQARKCNRKPDGRGCSKFTAKLEVCNQGGGKYEWQSSAKQEWKSNWKKSHPNSGNVDPAKRCKRINRRKNRACGRKPEGRRCQRLTSKAEEKGCNT